MTVEFFDNISTKETNIVKNNNKPPRMRIGTDNFETLLLNSDVFVDKSLMIKELLEDSGEVILITRPRRWGKSLNMNMLQKFFEIEVDQNGIPLPTEDRINCILFTGGEINLGIKGKRTLEPLKINGNVYAMTQQGQFPVISINFKDVKGSNYQEIENGIKNQVTNLFTNHRYLKRYITTDEKLLDDAQKEKLNRYFTGKLDKEDLKDSLRVLSEVLYKHFNQKVYILIDEYDTPINSSYIEFGDKLKEFDDVLKIFRGMFGSSLKTNPYLEKGVITGILRVAKANLFSDLNNVSEYSLLDEKYSKFYGFTQAEVDELLTKVPTATNPEQIKAWYNGYNFGGEIIYNPWSIMQCLAHKGKLDHYWLDSGGAGLVDKALLSDGMQEDLQSLAAGKAIISPIVKQISFADINKPVGLFSLLLFSGYLNPVAKKPEEDIYELSVPNKEVRYIYNARMLQWVTDQLQIDHSRYYSFATLLPTGKIEQFKERLQELLLNATSFYQTGEKKAELFYSGFMLGLINTLASDYIIDSERETGSGRADIMLIPRAGKQDNAIIIEYKICKSADILESVAKEKLDQIAKKQYEAKIKEYSHVQKIIKISMAFCGKEVAL
ncbi:AAA family ATPase [Rickettsia endosymbiont of Oedothorax gibbosus]|uniref:AAA family ATPase n=1 Tax=Rickettsia endosymbiont of Oedothorax gibbosus TaxID=931099 RepID=UPI0020246A50|nr:AAA family ATPase [Rickettsia endosymbiont of Oedothorax gibbosus]